MQPETPPQMGDVQSCVAKRRKISCTVAGNPQRLRPTRGNDPSPWNTSSSWCTQPSTLLLPVFLWRTGRQAALTSNQASQRVARVAPARHVPNDEKRLVFIQVGGGCPGIAETEKRHGVM